MSTASDISLPATDTPVSMAEHHQFRRHIGHISRQSSVFFAGTIFSTVTAYFFKVYLARVLGAEALGIYALGMTLIGFLAVFNSLGLPQAAIRFVAAYCADGRMDLLRGFLVRATLLLLFSNAFLAIGVIVTGRWIAVHLYHAPALKPYLSLFAIIMVLGAANTFLGLVLAGYKDVARRTVITNLIASPVMMVLAVVLVVLGFGLRGYILAQVMGGALTLLLLVLVTWRMTPATARHFSGALAPLPKEVLSFSAAAFGVSFLEFLMAQTDKIMIGFYLNPRELGIYAVAAALVAFIPIILQSVNQIFSPIISDLHTRGESQLLCRIFQTLTKWIIGFTLPISVVMISFAHPLMRIFGQDFETGWTILVIGALGQLVNCAVGSVGYLLLMSGNQRRLVQIQSFVAAVVVVLNLALIPMFGITGAAIAAALATVINNLWCLGAVRKILGFSPYNRSYLRLALPVASTIIVSSVLRQAWMSVHPEWLTIGASLAIAYVVFFASALAIGLDPDDRLIAHSMWSRVRQLIIRVEATA